MEIKEANLTPVEQRLIRLSDQGDAQYDPCYFILWKKQLLHDGENVGVFKAFTYKNSLRLSILLLASPGEKMTSQLLDEINTFVHATDKALVLLWYSQLRGFSTDVVDQLPHATDAYHFCKYALEKDAISPVMDLKGLTPKRCTADEIDACIEVMEDLFTPFSDTPGSFRQDRERICAAFLDHKHGGTYLFFKGDALVGFCGHHDGHLNEVCVRRDFQGQGYGEVMVRFVLQSIGEAGHDAELTPGYDNKRAISLYEKVGFTKIYESMRVRLYPAQCL